MLVNPHVLLVSKTVTKNGPAQSPKDKLTRMTYGLLPIMLDNEQYFTRRVFATMCSEFRSLKSRSVVHNTKLDS